MAAIDSVLAATALEHDLVLITPNLRDGVDLPPTVVNPWQGNGALCSPLCSRRLLLCGSRLGRANGGVQAAVTQRMPMALLS